ncbi:MAG: hypothetical protein AAB914_01870 [Patescibacteria group bacterium]
MSYSNSTIQPSLHEREKSPEDVARGRFHVVVNAVNNAFVFLPSETANTSTLGGEVVVSEESPEYGQNDPVNTNTTTDSESSYITPEVQNLERIRSDVSNNAIKASRMNIMFDDSHLEELIG